MDVFKQGNAIKLTAERVFRLENESLKLNARAVQLTEEAEKARAVLFDLFAELKASVPEQSIPELFTVNGVFIDLTDGKGYIALNNAPDLFELLNAVPGKNG
ncbi:hypothetical protein [Endozoicomonas atrinae]|uniref:hypothetical protein n=1 Tax=Endozoicomonas atrinae TaxID=1333660 RepID=UPI0008252191|nr:hypothetical protein [Endozoicomonas atrinae]